MKKNLLLASLAILTSTFMAAAAPNPFVGSWALTIPGGGAGWLGVEEEGGQLKGSVLWGGGSVLPVTSVKLAGDKLVVTRVTQPKAAEGKKKAEPITETI